MKKPAIIFDLDNTLANTSSLEEIRTNGLYDQLTKENLTDLKPYNPVSKTLESLHKKKIPLAIVTNSGSRYALPLLETMGIRKYFDAVVTYSDVGPAGKKPEPAGILKALEILNIEPSEEVLYIGDEYIDIIAAYRAGITPVIPSWASRKPVSMAPTIELCSSALVDYFDDPSEFRLIAERCAESSSLKFERKQSYFLPLDINGNTVTVKEQLRTICLGRFFSQRSLTTIKYREKHNLSLEIEKKESANYRVPDYWVELINLIATHSPTFLFGEDSAFDIITVIPSKQGKFGRLEDLLIRAKSRHDAPQSQFITDIFVYSDDAKSQKSLNSQERAFEANRSLHINKEYSDFINNKRILVIDDVLTTGATLTRALTLLDQLSAKSSFGLAIAKTVSIQEDEKICPQCSAPMRIRSNKITGEKFWGCSNFFNEDNKCEYTEAVEKRTCPVCSCELRLRVQRSTGDKFWGCMGFFDPQNKCNYTESHS